MADADLFEQIKITSDGAVCLGRSLVCDGFEPKLCAAVFTHIHHDHIGRAFGKCMHQYQVYASKTTSDLLEALTEDEYRHRTQFKAIEYGDPHPLKCGVHTDYVTLIESTHMLGSSQVLLTTHDGLKILYSGDISPQDRPPQCDILVIDSTHGTPHLDKKLDNESMERRLVDHVWGKLASKKPVCIHAHRGKLQQLMQLLSKYEEISVDIPFLTNKIDIRVAKVYQKYGYDLRDLVDLHEYEGEKIITEEYPWIEFTVSMNKTPRERKGRVSSIYVTGSYGNVPMSQDDEDMWMASNEHAEFNGILEYVKVAEPRVVVTDGSRALHGKTLADEIRSKLGIPSKHMPD